MSITTEIERIQNAKASIKTAIENKGVEVGDGTIDTYASKIDEISVGSEDSSFGDLIGGTIIEAVIPESTTELRSYAFANCPMLARVVLHEKIKSLGYSCFHLCTKLQDLTLPKSITKMDATCIQRCDNLINLTVNCIITRTFYLNYAKNLSVESVNSVINALTDLTGSTAQTLALHKDVKTKLTETQIASITSKNWTLA